MNKLFCISNDFSRNKKTYIVGTGRFALLQFDTLLQEDVYIEGFCTFDKSAIGMEIMNKNVLDINQFANDTYSNFIITEDDYAYCEKRLKDIGITNIWVDIRMYSLINDCVWTFM